MYALIILFFSLWKNSVGCLDLPIAAEYYLELLKRLLPKYYGITNAHHTHIIRFKVYGLPER